MKVKSDENLEWNFVIEISEFDYVEDIKLKLSQTYSENSNSFDRYFSIVYQNIILVAKKYITFYKISQNDEVWIGKIENYLNSDDVIIEIFVVDPIEEMMHVIMNRRDSIGQIRVILDKIFPGHDKVDIWNIRGEKLENDETIGEIGMKDQYHKVIVSCYIDYTFDQCCNMLDKYLIETVWSIYYLRNWGLYYTLMEPEIKQVSSSIDQNDPVIDGNISDMPSAFQNSTFFFCSDIVSRLLNVWKNKSRSNAEKCHDEIPFYVYEAFFTISIWRSVLDYLDSRQHAHNSTPKPFVDIWNEAIHYLTDSSTNSRDVSLQILHRFLLKPDSDSSIDRKFARLDRSCLWLSVRTKLSEFTIPLVLKSIQTVFDAKKEISRKIGIAVQQLYMVKSGADEKPKDDDRFEFDEFIPDEYFVEILLNMKDIETLSELGKGAFGEVFLCRNKSSQKCFAMKKGINTDLYRDISIQSKIRRSSFNLKYMGLFCDRGHICIGMPYFSGGTLSEYIKKEKSLPEVIIARISSQILEQIENMHHSQVIHRDIKSDNILLDENLNARLVDFGVSKCTIDLSLDTKMERLRQYKPGTMFCMAPEILKVDEYSEKIDIWSFGATVVAMITGRTSYSHREAIQIAVRVAKTKKIEFTPPEPISEELTNFIDACLEPDPNDRASASELLESEFIVKYCKKDDES